MIIPISFDEVSYFKNEFRGDLIVTEGVLYYLPHTRVSYSHFSDEIKGKETVEYISLAGNFIPLAGLAPWAYEAVDKSVKFAKFVKRNVAPTINNARIRKDKIWQGNENSAQLQSKLDAYVAEKKSEALQFDDDSVPKPMRFDISEMENIKLGFKLRFDAKYDNHDFRINPIRMSLLRRAMKEGGFIS
ncbi:MAG: hypothetical protein WBD16_11335 [Pyrinomonadaceae bacterium]